MAITLLDIKNHMINYLSSMELDDDDYYDDDGHCGGQLLAEIKSFWRHFSTDTDKDFIYVVSGKYMSDDIDLDGARDYFFSSSGVIPMLFDYLYNTLGYSLNQYQHCIWNSTGLTDDLWEMYDDPAIIRDSRINEILEDEILEDDPIKNSVIVLKYPKHMKAELDANPIFTFLGVSKVDNENPIYSIIVPQGYTIVPDIKEILK